MNKSISEERILKVRNLSKQFDVSEKGIFKSNKQFLKAVQNLNFDVYKGETFGIVGESGCGKSTTGKLIMQLLEATEGTVEFEGVNLGELSAEELRKKRKGFQMVFQDPYSSLNPRMKAFDLIAEPLLSHQIVKNKKELRKEVLSLMESVGLNEKHANRYPHEFSGGQKQRIGIARALALKPKLIICDEPVSALDVSIQSQILNLLKELQEKYSFSYIFIAHGLPAIKYVSDRIAVMYLGRIVEMGTKEQIFNKMKHPYTQGLLSAVPISSPENRKENDRILLEGDIPSPINQPSGCPFHPRCPFATSVCKEHYPETTIDRNGHSVACHHPLNEEGDAN